MMLYDSYDIIWYYIISMILYNIIWYYVILYDSYDSYDAIWCYIISMIPMILYDS